MSAKVENLNASRVAQVVTWVSEIADAIVAAEQGKQKAKAASEGAYSKGIRTAILATHAAEMKLYAALAADSKATEEDIDAMTAEIVECRKAWFEGFDLYVNMIRKNEGGLGKTLKAEKADKNTRGIVYKVPSSLQQIRTIINSAWTLGAPLWKLERDGDKKDRDGNPLFRPVLDADGVPVPQGITVLNRELAARREQRNKEAIRNLGGYNKLRYDTEEALQRLIKLVRETPETHSAWVQEIYDFALKHLEPKAEQKEVSKETQETIDANKALAAKLKAEREERESAEQSVGAELAKASEKAEERAKAPRKAKGKNKAAA